MIFNSFFKYTDKIDCYPIEDINNEVMFLQSDLDFVYKNGSPITKVLCNIITGTTEFKELSRNKKHIILDTRVNNLTPATYPSIPGWHCDDVYRKDKYSQPDLLLKDKIMSYHWMCLVGNEDSISNTDYIAEAFPEVQVNEKAVWKSLNNNINKNITRYNIQKVEGNRIILFNNQLIHRASPATKYGIRLFFRLSATYREPLNIIRKNVTSYIDVTTAGW